MCGKLIDRQENLLRNAHRCLTLVIALASTTAFAGACPYSKAKVTSANAAQKDIVDTAVGAGNHLNYARKRGISIWWECLSLAAGTDQLSPASFDLFMAANAVS